MSRAKSVPFETTLRVRDCCLCLHVQRAARALARRFDEALRPIGLTNGQFSLMMSLNRPEPPGIVAVADLLAMDRTTLTAALKPLERRGLVTVARDPSDRRGNSRTSIQIAFGAACALSPDRSASTATVPSSMIGDARLHQSIILYEKIGGWQVQGVTFLKLRRCYRVRRASPDSFPNPSNVHWLLNLRPAPRIGTPNTSSF
jgi:hypothetical protein